MIPFAICHLYLEPVTTYHCSYRSSWLSWKWNLKLITMATAHSQILDFSQVLIITLYINDIIKQILSSSRSLLDLGGRARAWGLGVQLVVNNLPNQTKVEWRTACTWIRLAWVDRRQPEACLTGALFKKVMNFKLKGQ